ncbi:hypothetical protein [Flavobacterium sp. GCM10027622]|uniref:hypothetical protein n=1 Tax=unclassified Flavobacterium TaxID=196869 RepID=UPI00360B0C43
MRKKILTILLILFCAISYSQNDTIIDHKLNYKVVFLSKSDFSSKNSDSALGKINFYRYNSIYEGDIYAISMSEFTELKHKLSEKEVAAMVVGFKKGFSNSLTKEGRECNFISEKKFKFKNEFEAIEFLGKINNQIDFKMNFILKGNVTYALLVIGQTESENAQFFMNSFDFIDSNGN